LHQDHFEETDGDFLGRGDIGYLGETLVPSLGKFENRPDSILILLGNQHGGPTPVPYLNFAYVSLHRAQYSGVRLQIAYTALQFGSEKTY
jgi:hypothetical protein